MSLRIFSARRRAFAIGEPVHGVFAESGPAQDEEKQRGEKHHDLQDELQRGRRDDGQDSLDDAARD